MRIEVIRTDFTDKSTIGRMSIDGIFQCYTLEDRVHEGPKIPGATAIPLGTYEVALTYSPRFEMLLPLLMDVPDFSGVRIHAGNTEADTAGCILVGRSRRENELGESRAALSLIVHKIRLAQMDNKIHIAILNQQEESHG